MSVPFPQRPFSVAEWNRRWKASECGASGGVSIGGGGSARPFPEPRLTTHTKSANEGPALPNW